jgi:hypothetical protein
MVSRDGYPALKSGLEAIGYKRKPIEYIDFRTTVIPAEPDEFDIKKQHEEFVNDEGIVVDVHTAYSNYIKKDEQNLHAIFTDSIRRDTLGCKPAVLGLYDTIIQSLLHFSHHYINDNVYNGLFRGAPVSGLSLKDMLDVALCIGKYGSDIDWDALYDRMEAFGCMKETAFALRVFDGIFGGMLDRGFIEKIQNNKPAFNLALYDGVTAKIPVDKLIKLDFNEYMASVESEMEVEYLVLNLNKPAADEAIP